MRALIELALIAVVVGVICQGGDDRLQSQFNPLSKSCIGILLAVVAVAALIERHLSGSPTHTVALSAHVRPFADHGLAVFTPALPLLVCAYQAIASTTNNNSDDTRADFGALLCVTLVASLHALLYADTQLPANLHSQAKAQSIYVSIPRLALVACAYALFCFMLGVDLHAYHVHTLAVVMCATSTHLATSLLAHAPRSFTIGEAHFIASLGSLLFSHAASLSARFVLDAVAPRWAPAVRPLFLHAFSDATLDADVHKPPMSTVAWSVYSLSQAMDVVRARVAAFAPSTFSDLFLTDAVAAEDPDALAHRVLPLLLLTPLLLCLFPPLARRTLALRHERISIAPTPTSSAPEVIRADRAWLVCWCATVLGCVYPWMRLQLGGRDPFVWVVRFICRIEHANVNGTLVDGAPVRLYICTAWSAALLATIVFQPTAHNTHAENIIVRKFFHALAVLMFVPALVLEPLFLAIAAAGAFGVLCTLELARFARVAPFADALDAYMSVYRDERDAGALLVTHIYLLAGCALPLWLHVPWLGTSSSPSSIIAWRVPAAAGVLVLGVGDSLASWAGRRLGRTHWPSTRKTIEGTLVAALAVAACMTTLLATGGGVDTGSAAQLIVPPARKLAALAAVATLIMALEAFTLQVDNLALPPLAYALTCVALVNV